MTKPIIVAAWCALVVFPQCNLRADEPIELLPREAEILTVMPRVVTAAPSIDPPWIYRGAVRPEGTFEAPLPYASNDVNRRQVELLRALDQLLPSGPQGIDLRGWEFRSIAEKLGKPETLPIPPRVVK